MLLAMDNHQASGNFARMASNLSWRIASSSNSPIFDVEILILSARDGNNTLSDPEPGCYSPLFMIWPSWIHACLVSPLSFLNAFDVIFLGDLFRKSQQFGVDGILRALPS